MFSAAQVRPERRPNHPVCRHLFGARILFCLASALCVVGCATPETPYPASLNSERPDERALAARHAADIDDRSVIGILIDRLEDEDDAVRFYAIAALERLTGSRRGYRYYEPESERLRAVQRWRGFLSQTDGATPAPNGGSDR